MFKTVIVHVMNPERVLNSWILIGLLFRVGSYIWLTTTKFNKIETFWDSYRTYIRLAMTVWVTYWSVWVRRHHIHCHRSRTRSVWRANEISWPLPFPFPRKILFAASANSVCRSAQYCSLSSAQPALFGWYWFVAFHRCVSSTIRPLKKTVFRRKRAESDRNNAKIARDSMETATAPLVSKNENLSFEVSSLSAYVNEFPACFCIFLDNGINCDLGDHCHIVTFRVFGMQRSAFSVWCTSTSIRWIVYLLNEYCRFPLNA